MVEERKERTLGGKGEDTARGRIGEAERGREGELGRAVGGQQAPGGTMQGDVGRDSKVTPGGGQAGGQEFRCTGCGESFGTDAARTEHNQAKHAGPPGGGSGARGTSAQTGYVGGAQGGSVPGPER